MLVWSSALASQDLQAQRSLFSLHAHTKTLHLNVHKHADMYVHKLSCTIIWINLKRMKIKLYTHRLQVVYSGKMLHCLSGVFMKNEGRELMRAKTFQHFMVCTQKLVQT